MEYRQAIKKCMVEMMDIDLSSIIPYMIKHKLLTQAEAESLQKRNEISMSTNVTLFSMLENKGPTTHYLFVQCLSEETDHPPQQELYHTVCGDELLQPPSPKSRRPNNFEIQQPLVGNKYQ